MMQEDDEVCERRRAGLSSPTIYVLQMVIYFLIVCHIMMSTRTTAPNVIIAVAALVSRLSVLKVSEVCRGP